MKIYLVRHGETDWNAKRWVQGHTNIPLNAAGVQQAKDAAYFFETNKPDRVYSSDLDRAAHTAELLSGQQPIKKAGFKEKSFGEAEGVYVEDARAKWGVDPFHLGEQPDKLADRMEQAYWETVEESKQAGAERVLVAAHGACLKTLVKRLVESGKVDGGEFRDEIIAESKRFTNCCVTIIDNSQVTAYALALTDASTAYGKAV